jgi:hypothetical protein
VANRLLYRNTGFSDRTFETHFSPFRRSTFQKCALPPDHASRSRRHLPPT